MESAGIEKEISFKDYEDIHAGIVKWPMSVIRLNGRDPQRIADLAEAIVAGRDIAADEVLNKHAEWVDQLKQKYSFTEDNALEIILQETGKVFAEIRGVCK